jgi:hypothetical protein
MMTSLKNYALENSPENQLGHKVMSSQPHQKRETNDTGEIFSTDLACILDLLRLHKPHSVVSRTA